MATYGEYAPIASDVGHGAPGLRDNLRPFSELVTQSASQKQVFVSVRPARLLTGWSNYSSDGSNSGTYVIPWRETWDGILRDVVGMRTTSETLSRAETLAACAATEGTYYYDADQVVGSYNLWDDGTVWDGGELWDAGLPLLYCHPTDGEDPDDVDTVALCGFYFGSDSVVQPTLGVEKLTNGDLETWSSATNAGTWTEGTYGTGGGAIAQDTGIDGFGTYSAKLSGALNAAGGYGIIQQTTGVVGKMYRASGWYKTDATNPAGIEARIRVGINGGPNPNQYLLSDGTNITTGTTGFALADTHGYARRFSFDFVCPADTTVLELNAFAWNSTGGALTAVGVWFDGLSLKRIWRFERYQSRLDVESGSRLEQKRSDSFFGPQAFPSGVLSLINGDGSLEAPAHGLDWVGARLYIYSGGRFVEGGNEILADDLWLALSGIASDTPTVTDLAFSLPYEGLLSCLSVQLPPRTYPNDTYTTMPESDAARPRPLIFGQVANIKAVRIEKQSNGLPIYELRDTSFDVGAPTVGTVSGYAYASEEAADKQDAQHRITAGASGFTTYNKLTGTMTLATDFRVIEVEQGVNDSLDFSVAGTPYTGAMPAGRYTWGDPLSLATYLRAALNGAGAGVIFNLPTYDLTTGGKATITASSAFAILTGTGNWRGNSFWPLLGFTTHADVVAATSQTSDTGMFTDCDSQIIPRFTLPDLLATADDSSGTYTGSANFPIATAGPVLKFLLRRFGGVEAEDIGTFTTGPAVVLYVGISDRDELRTIIGRLENSAYADLMSVGGKFSFVARDSSVPTDVVDLIERDYLSFSSYYDQEDIFKTVRVGYAQDAASGRWSTVETTTSSVEMRFRRRDQRTFYTYLPSTALSTAQTRLASFVADATAKRRRFSVRVKGKLFRLGVGSKVRISRDKGVDTSGAISQLLCRIVSKSDDLLTHETEAELIEIL